MQLIFYKWVLSQAVYEANKPFMRFLKKLRENLTGYNIIWNNLYKHSYVENNTKSGKGLYGKIDNVMYDTIMNQQIELHSYEIEILKPEYYIFLTGHNLDTDIEKLFSVSITKNKVFSPGSVELILNGPLISQQHALRTYHPQYLQLSKQFNDVSEWMIEHIKHN